MRASGDWIHPTFNAEPRYHKPVLIYWLMLAGTAIGRRQPVRRPARLGAGRGRHRACSSGPGAGGCSATGSGCSAALILATAPIVVAESKLATTDATLAFLVVGCQFCLWELAQRALEGRGGRLLGRSWRWRSLTKGPVGPALIVASAGVSWWWGGPTACWKRLHWRWGPGGLRRC